MKKLIIIVLIEFIFFENSNAQIRINSSGLVGIGTTDVLARLNLESQLSAPGATNLLIGKWNTNGQGCLSLGVHNNYSWMQTWNNLPLYINSQGNDVIFFNDVLWNNIGIGVNSPSCRLQVSGSIMASGIVTWSDINLNKNIQKLSAKKDLMDKINQLEPIIFDWNDDLINKANIKQDTLSKSIGKVDKDFFNRVQYGFSAQHVQKIFPELVYEDNTGTLGINYQGFIPMLFTMVDSLKTTVQELQNQIVIMNSAIKTLEDYKQVTAAIGSNTTDSKNNKSILYQNSPNPFTSNTIIKYYLTNAISNAIINIYSMNGQQIKSFELDQRGEGNITIKGEELHPGMYLYTLITDREVIDTKRMIITD